MNIEPVLATVAARIREHLPEDNPWKDCLTATVEDPKEGPNTWAVLHAVGEPRELVAGNNTVQATCRLYAQIVPTEGAWSAEQMVQYAAEMADAIALARDDMKLAMYACSARWVVLGLHLAGGGVMRAEEAVGYVFQQSLLLSVQF